jgi:predicted nucleotidyltransferase
LADVDMTKVDTINFPRHVIDLISYLLGISMEVWLIGSRANETYKASSDWDFLVFGNKMLLNEISKIPIIKGVDVLVVIDGNEFERPWCLSDGTSKSGSLISWDWKKLSDSEATYKGTKWPADRGSIKKALRLHL